MHYTMKNYTKQRNISLFHLIPAQRTCDDLNLEPHWCSCLQWTNLNINDTKVKQATNHIINYINKQLLSVKNILCQQLQFYSIHNVQIYQPNKALLTFSSSSDIDGRIPTYDDKKTDIIFYQITFETQPNRAIYEATTQYSNRSNDFNTDLNHISRINAYKSSASCIEKSYSHLRKFCHSELPDAVVVVDNGGLVDTVVTPPLVLGVVLTVVLGSDVVLKVVPVLGVVLKVLPVQW
ncbi:unnamed protein product [Rotaria sp. Silwood2]|nr:unnamed protein product [Rotaria sp. Silwood2]